MHHPVLLQESLDLLDINPDGIYIDGTFGRGGHSQQILARLSKHGRLIACDKDPEAVTYAKQHVNDERFSIYHQSFVHIDEILQQQSLTTINGVLVDLGVSSPQFDTPERGFSFRHDAPLDMRMDNSRGISASDFINSADAQDLARIFWEYGEERYGRKIAQAIVNKRKITPITTTCMLANLVEQIIGRHEQHKHPATRVFQALRIHVNNELADLKFFLDKAPDLLAKNGRLVVISFHSLEDRLVKNKLMQLAQAPILPRWVMQNSPAPQYKIIAKKKKASLSEINHNNRSRSAIMRAIAKL